MTTPGFVQDVGNSVTREVLKSPLSSAAGITGKRPQTCRTQMLKPIIKTTYNKEEKKKTCPFTSSFNSVLWI
jgi:hypothetical protein